MNNIDMVSNLSSFAKEISSSCLLFSNDDLPEAFQQAMLHNKWFTKSNILVAMNHWANSLADEKTVELWISKYNLAVVNSQKVLLILAGNIPAVGFHDVLCTLLSGHEAEIKLSSDDRFLIPWMLRHLVEYFPEWKDKYRFHDGLISEFDAVIATGSNQTAKTFESYFSKKPRIIRHNRSSMAVVHQNDNSESLQKLGEDVFLYFGLGCRNVSLIFLPEGFDKQRLFDAFLPWNYLAQHNAYVNNHDYYNGYFSLTNEELLDGNFYLLRKKACLYAPLSVLNFQEYNDIDQAKSFIEAYRENIQCVVSAQPIVPNTIMPGQTQLPSIDEYADGEDTMEFLLGLDS